MQMLTWPDSFVNKIICGDVLEVLRQMPDGCVDTIITSPPYWGLRDYGEETKTVWGGDPECKHKWGDSIPPKNYRSGKHGPGSNIGAKEAQHAVRTSSGSNFCQKCGAWHGQLGLEPTLDLYLEHLLQVTTELKRVLKPTGVMWWDHGDCYHSKPAGNTKRTKAQEGYDGLFNRLMDRHTQGGKSSVTPKRLAGQEKCLALQNYRLLLQLVDEQGWILRNQCPWVKPNAMPSSVKDRLTNKWEPVFMLVKNASNPQYYYNIKTGLMADKKPKKKDMRKGIDWGFEKVGIIHKNSFNTRVRDAEKPRYLEGATKEEIENYGKGKIKKVNYWKAVRYWFDLDAVRVPHKTENNQQRPRMGQGNKTKYKQKRRGLKSGNPNIGSQQHHSENINYSKKGKNPGDVWRIATQPFPEAHFATFPEKLVEPMIKASCPKEICKKCGKARVRISETSYQKHRPSGGEYTRGSVNEKRAQTGNWGTMANNLIASRETTGWTDCGCGAGWESGVVLDPFIGSGTTAKVALQLGRRFIGVDISERYCQMARERIKAELAQGRLF